MVILKPAAGGPIPLYGDGLNVRDWLYVDDHVVALLLTATRTQLTQLGQPITIKIPYSLLGVTPSQPQLLIVWHVS